MMKLTLDRILQSQGFGTRKYCQSLIQDGDVAFNGVVLRKFQDKIDTENLVLKLDAEDHIYRAQVYIALNKPMDYECSRKPSHHPSILDLLPEEMTWREVQPVGRLDHDTTGLLLLSDDGAFIHAQSSPKHHVAKRYLATTAEAITPELISALLSGVQLIDEKEPLHALECVQVSTHQLEIVLEQGKYHQVKRMLAAAGNHCAALQRIQIGALKLVDLGLELGEWCYVNADLSVDLR